MSSWPLFLISDEFVYCRFKGHHFLASACFWFCRRVLNRCDWLLACFWFCWRVLNQCDWLLACFWFCRRVLNRCDWLRERVTFVMETCYYVENRWNVFTLSTFSFNLLETCNIYTNKFQNKSSESKESFKTTFEICFVISEKPDFKPQKPLLSFPVNGRQVVFLLSFHKCALNTGDNQFHIIFDSYE